MTKPKPVIEASPSILTDADVALKLAEMLKSLAAQRMDVKLIQIANGHSAEDSLPGATYTYGEKLKTLDDGAQRLREHFDVSVVARADTILDSQGQA